MNVKETAKWLTCRPINTKTIHSQLKIGRNAKCNCGSGVKAKFCGCQSERIELKKQQMIIEDEVINLVERRNFEQLIKKGIVVEL